MRFALSNRLWIAFCLLPPMAMTEVRAADLVALSPQTFDRYAPQGKEVDAIYGDFALTNDKLIAIIANPKAGRNANMTVRDVGGCLIDLTLRGNQSDQLSAYYPGAQSRDLRFGGIDVQSPRVYETGELDRVFVQGKRITFRLVAKPKEKEADVEVSYTLEDGWDHVLVTTKFVNRQSAIVDVSLTDALRADHSFEFSTDPKSPMFWAYDQHFGQAYGVSAEGYTVSATTGRRLLVRFANADGKIAIALKPGESHELTRRIIPGANLFDLNAVNDRFTGGKEHAVEVVVKDTSGKPVPGADVKLARDGKAESWGRTNADGKIRLTTREKAGVLTVASQSRGTKDVTIAADQEKALEVVLPEAATVVTAITDGSGGPIPCKVQFIGKDGLKSPDFGPDSAEIGVKNIHYSHDGKFERDLAPGTYDVIVSYGPEYDAIFTKLDLTSGKTTKLEAKLVRTVSTPGWVSTDYHSHSSPSGDNTASQLGRVLNLLCEHIEFAPCTEHNRLSTYDPHLVALNAVERMATCVGMEMTGQPLPLNHQNAFPLIMRPHTQDNGGPQSDQDPETQIERLAFWDGGTDKLVQVNHPDMGWMFRDRNGNGAEDAGFAGMQGQMDVIEVHPLNTIFDKPSAKVGDVTHNNTVVNWLQLLNQGKRIPGVVNTDAHYNYHGSGYLRNYVKSPTDDPSRIQTLDMVHASERGNLVMTTGPFMDLTLVADEATDKPALPGDDLVARSGKTTLKVRVQCPNWFDIDRVQVLINGSPSKDHNFTRDANSDKFGTGVVKFEQTIPIELPGDAHVIVVAAGEKSGMGSVLGPEHAKDQPFAVSNPIFVDVDGNGFKANGDTLGGLPVKGGR